MPIDRPSSKYRFAILTFWLTAVAIQLNFNHVSSMIIGTGWFFTLGVALCSIFLILVVRIPLRRILGLPGYLVVAALASYLVVGGGVISITDSEWRMENHRLPLVVCLAIFVIVASALGASVVLRRFGVEYLLARILAIKAVVCISILATPLLVEYAYHALPEYYQGVSRTRFSGVFHGPNFAGAAACQAVALSLSLLSGRRSGFLYLVAILGSVAVVLTFSRAAILTLVLVLLFFLWSSMPNRHTRTRPYSAVWMVSILVIGILALALINLEHLPLEKDQLDRLKWIMNRGVSDISNDRFTLWHLGISRIAESPLFGYGLSQFHSLPNAPVCYGGPIIEVIECGIHNTYLLIWGEAGIIPLMLFLLFISSLLRACLTLPKSAATTTAAAWTIILAVECMATDGTPFFAWNAFTIGLICALVTHVVRGSRERRTEEVPGARNRYDLGPSHAVQGRNFHVE